MGMWVELAVLAGFTVATVCALPPFTLEPVVEKAKDAVSKAKPVEPTGLNKTSYLDTIAGIVHYFKLHQNSDGAIIDPYVHEEIQ